MSIAFLSVHLNHPFTVTKGEMVVGTEKVEVVRLKDAKDASALEGVTFFLPAGKGDAFSRALEDVMKVESMPTTPEADEKNYPGFGTMGCDCYGTARC